MVLKHGFMIGHNHLLTCYKQEVETLISQLICLISSLKGEFWYF